MIAIEISRSGGPDVLLPVERPRPVPQPGDVLIEVAAAGINRPDAMQRRGVYPPPQGVSDIPGLEVAGTIVDVGPEAGDWTAGRSGLRAGLRRRLCRVLRGARRAVSSRSAWARHGAAGRDP